MTNKKKSLAMTIAGELKDAGIPRKAYSIRTTSGGSIRISVKDLSVSLDRVKFIAEKYESYQVDERTQEILCGGNTFVFVEHDWDALTEGRNKFLAEATEVYENGTHEIMTNSKGDILAFMKTDIFRGDHVYIKYADGSYDYKRKYVYHPEMIATCMAIFSASGQLGY